jgi:hypothetical protein
MVSLFGGSVAVLLLIGSLSLECIPCSRPQVVDIFTGSWELDFQHLLAILSFDLFRPTEVLGSAVVSFRSPCDIMQVAHSVHHQDVDVGREEEHVLYETGEHVPRLEVHERGDEVKAICSQ